MILSARTSHETGNWFVTTDYPDAFSTLNRTAVLVEMATCLPPFASLLTRTAMIQTADGRVIADGFPWKPGQSFCLSRVHQGGSKETGQCCVWRCG